MTKALLDDVRGIVVYIRGHRLCSDLWRKKKQKSLSLSMKVRWNSILVMIDGFLAGKDALNSILFDPPTEGAVPVMISSDECVALREIQEMLELFDYASTVFSGEKYCVIGRVIPMMNSLEKALAKFSASQPASQECLKSLRVEVVELFGQDERKYLLAAATVLDPRLKKMPFKKPSLASLAVEQIDKEVKKEALKRMQVSNQVTRADESQEEKQSCATRKKGKELIMQQHQELKKKERLTHAEVHDSTLNHPELKTYLREPTVTLKDADFDAFDPMKFWSDRKTVAPNLAAVALRHLSRIASSVPCERLFSHVAYVTEDERNNTTSEHADMLMFLEYTEFEDWML